MGSISKEKPKLISLKDLMPLRPWNSPPLPLSELRGRQYMKLKKPIFKDGVEVYWLPKILANEDEVPETVIPFQGVFKFIDRHVLTVVKRWIGKIVE
ncbi:hypothetical protein MtrunA17_Chr1g0157161 [Medicago truncatula]|uniref:Uncharacterized protein n=2 Tax=Medicago truncatula TaxID=3880 RepID=A0A396JLX1_MEDTR|nr:hypothetical protein MtrunA17_Chr1g0157161 [Medicago truncatula]